ncbi:Transcription factor [Penicillium cf. griseofulvum]|uniref:Transcription factor n=1 Tax=Penicillium cf. griseofulvum TaxID=2972120 RepID=A0A9W9MSV0_9EURO|nr:Transcription factor [Penicillium cf. griseofulvum]KAJ5446434.1 Transcription factor [Penicillium cf. griseofulvum]KAJ5448175.1 Transcription factor [Penicillium cf. griseofulvum]
MSGTPTTQGESSISGSAQQLNRSCESCRSLKVRCLPSPSTPNQCQRCAKGKRSCVFVAPQRRRPRKRTDSRVAQLEKEMRVMRSLLKNRIPEEEEDPNSDDDSDVDDLQDHESADMESSLALRDHSAHSSEDVRYTDYSPELLNTPHPGAHDGGGFSAPPTFAGMPAGFESEHERVPPTPDVIDRGIISLEYAEQLVAYFIHELAFFFPLIVLPSNTTAAQLRQTKPILFLSVIAATSITVDAGLAAVLNREMVRLYAERFFIEGEKSLELVQALLLMIIFYLPPASPLKLQLYQYTHIASTMALEIGLANKRRVSTKSNRKGSRQEPHDELLAEQARAVLGCYHLGSSVAMKTRRPNLLQFNDWMSECLKHLENSPHRTDQHVAIWFELQRITDEAMSSFGLDDTSTTSPLTESRVQAVLRWFDKRIETWKKNIPPEMLTIPMILEYRSTALAMYELGVGEGYRDPDSLKRRYFTLPTLDEENNSGSEPPDATLSATRIDINMKWMNAAQELLDAVLTCSTETLRKIPNLMYTRFVMAVTSLLKIHFSVRTGVLGEVITPQTVNVAFYLDALASKLGEASGGGKYNIPSRWYHVVGVKGRDWYERLERRYSGATEAGSRVVSASPSTSTAESISGPASHSSQGQSQNQDAHLGQVSKMESFPVPVPMPPMQPVDGMRDGYVAMSGTGMWAMDSGHNPHFYPMGAVGYQPSVSLAQTLPPQFSYAPQRIPAGAAGQHNARAGMELDGWLPDGSIFGIQPLPEF